MSAAVETAPLFGALAPRSEDRRELWEFVESTGLRSVVVGLSKDPNAKVTVLLVSSESGRSELAIKAPTTEGAARAVEAEETVLAELGRRAPRLVMQTVPRIVGAVSFEGRPALVMTALQGEPMTTSYVGWRHTARRGRVAADFDAVGRWLAELQLRTARNPAPVDFDGGVTAALRDRFAGDERLADDLDRLEVIHGRLRREATPRTVVHGDLWFGNVLLTHGNVSGVVDWEAGAITGEPVRDIVRFALMYALYLDSRTRPGRRVSGHSGLRAIRRGVGVEYALDGRGWFSELFRRFIEDGLYRLGASPAIWRDVAVAGIAEVAALTDNPEFARFALDLFRRVAHRQPLGKDR